MVTKVKILKENKKCRELRIIENFVKLSEELLSKGHSRFCLGMSNNFYVLNIKKVKDDALDVVNYHVWITTND